MGIELWITFVLATIAFGLIPGPNVALTVANSVTYGPRYGLLTVAGTTSAMVPQLVLTVLGMTAFTTLLAGGFEILRWVGVAYLLFLGWKQWNAPVVDLTQIKPQPKSMRALFWRGFFVSSTNPKTLLFYGAFFPQFVNGDAPIMPQLIVMSLTFIVVITMIDSGWALLAGSARKVLAAKGRLRNRISGGFLMAAALGLSLAKK